MHSHSKWLDSKRYKIGKVSAIYIYTQRVAMDEHDVANIEHWITDMSLVGTHNTHI